MTMNIQPKFLIFPFLVVTVVFGTIYVTAQQMVRLGANDSQVQIAGDMASLLNSGARLSDIETQIKALRKVDPTASAAPFVGVYDEQGKLVATSGAIDGDAIVPPAGVFAAADKKGGDYRLTLEPVKGVRIAGVVRAFDQAAFGQGKGYVVSGKSLSEAEARIKTLGFLVLLGWAISLCIFLSAAVWMTRASKR